MNAVEWSLLNLYSLFNFMLLLLSFQLLLENGPCQPPFEPVH
uniref:Uncharacterized protein n=1 Tax=Ciona intestinalis TaxID=7719 RepID=H2XML7_CIOIN